MLIVFTTAKIWDQPKCPKMDDWGKNVAYKYNGILFGYKE
jgi:hypothetical protein